MGERMNQSRRENERTRQAVGDMMRTAEKIFYMLAIPIIGFALYQLLKLWMNLH
ncbi:hypothetical protein J2785_007241 [Burkholderia ambifaria]|nr:hypothetical protein [Burkholderia ambifaria]